MLYFECPSVQKVVKKKRKFMQKFLVSENKLCGIFTANAATELYKLWVSHKNRLLSLCCLYCTCTCLAVQTIQSSFVSTQDETKIWQMRYNFTQKYYDIIEAPQKLLYTVTMGKYISDDAFIVSMTASCSSQSWEISLSGLPFSLWDFC